LLIAFQPPARPTGVLSAPFFGFAFRLTFGF